MNTENKIIKLCAQGMEQEGLGEKQKASGLFNDAWNNASTDYEKAIAAHYVARHQPHVSQKLVWDRLALTHAMLSAEDVKGFFPSLYLNIAKCYEDLGEKKNAVEHYQLASGCLDELGDDGYGRMIRAGVEAGIKRVNQS